MSARPYTRHGLTAPMAKVKLRGLRDIDQRSAAARRLLAFRCQLEKDLGGRADLSAQQLALVELASRARLLLDHVDAYLLEQASIINRRTRSLLPIMAQRQALAEHLARLLTDLGLERRPGRKLSLAERLQPKGGDA